MKHILSIADWTAGEIATLLDQADSFVAQAAQAALPDRQARKATLFFPEPSTRTCDSYDEAAQLIGCRRRVIVGEGATSLYKGESLSASGRMEAGYNADILVMRTKAEGGARWMAEMLDQYGYRTAVQNGGDGSNEHPSQAFLDLLTIRRRLGRLSDFTIGIVGDLKNSRTVHSLVRALRLLPDIRIVLVSAPEVRLQRWYTAGLPIQASESDSLEALQGCDIVMVTRVQKERFASEFDYQKVRGRYVVNEATLRMLGPKALILHPQPIADNEVAPEIWAHPQVIMDEQARMGVPTRMALLVHSLQRLDESGFRPAEPPTVVTVHEGSMREALARKHEKASYFTPIEDGTVIDHLRHGLGAKVMGLLRLSTQVGVGVVVLSEGLRTSKVPGGRKAAIALEHYFLTPQQKAAITLLSPEATFNEFRDGSILIKTKIGTFQTITGIGRCPNPNCVTRLDVQAALHPTFTVSSDAEPDLCCHYCEQHFPQGEIFHS